MASTSDFKNGLVLNIDGQLWTITEFQHVKPGKGPAFVRTTLKNVMTGKVVDKTFNAGVKVDTATVDKRDMTYLYKDGSEFVFMDGDTYDQIHIPAETVGSSADYLLENQEALVAQNGIAGYGDRGAGSVIPPEPQNAGSASLVPARRLHLSEVPPITMEKAKPAENKRCHGPGMGSRRGLQLTRHSAVLARVF